MSFCPPYLKLLAVLSLAGSLGIQRAVAQINVANDGTGTQVNQNGNTTNILGGTTSGNNLFHSFWDFNVGTGQIANFWSLPDIQNILARVTGGNTSIIDGLMQVTGSNANLFLLNTTGIIFGAGASLNVPGSFMATTATGIGFGNAWFNATGNNDYRLLTGDPTSLAFTGSQVGGIVNQGSLSTPGGTLSLVAGGVYSPGTLGGQGVTVSTVGSGSFVRLNQPGQLLSLLVPPNPWNQSIQTLPQLLTGGNVLAASTMTLAADGSVVIGGSGLVLQDRDIMLGEVNSGQLALEGQNITFTDINKAEDVILNASGFVMGNSITTAPTSANTNAFNINVTAGGSVNIQTINASGNLQGTPSGNPTGNGGNVSVQSTGGDIQLGSIATDGSVLGGNINLTADVGSITVGSVDTRAYGQGGQGGNVYINATTNLTFTGNITTGIKSLDSNAGTVFLYAKDGFILVQDIFTDANLANAGSIQLIALGGAITTGNLSASSGGGNGGDITLSATQNLQTGGLTTIALGAGRQGGTISLNGGTITATGDITTGNIGAAGNAGFINILSDGAIQLKNLFADSSVGFAGSVNLESTNGSISANFISATGLGFDLNELTLDCVGCLSELTGVNIQASTDITTGNINVSNPNLGVANRIILTSSEGNISTGDLQATAQDGDGGSISMVGETVTTGNISTFSLNNGNGGFLSILANTNLNTANIATYANSAGFYGGYVYLNGGGNISVNGNITTGTINTAAGGGSVSLTGGGNVTTHNIYVDSSVDQAGLVYIYADGNINARMISATSNIEQFDEGERVQIWSQGSLTVGDINTSGFINGGDISLISISGDINTTGGAITAMGNQGNSGTVSIFAEQGDITTGLIDTSNISFGSGGSVYLEAYSGQVTLGPVNSFANGTGQQGGIVSAIAGTNIITTGDVVAGNANGSFNANAGNIEFTANGFINTTASGLFALSNLGDGGVISLAAGDYIRAGDVGTGSLGFGFGGTISLMASNAISTEGLVALGSGATTGGGLLSIGNSGPVSINDLVSLGAEVLISGASSITINGDWTLIGSSFTPFNFGVNSGGGDFTVNGTVSTNGGSFEVLNAGNLTFGSTASLFTAGGQINLIGNQVTISGLLNSSGGNLNLAGNAGLGVIGSLLSDGGTIGLASASGTIQIDGIVDSSGGVVNVLDFNNSFLLNGSINTRDAAFTLTGNSLVNIRGSVNAGAINLEAEQILASGYMTGTTLNFNGDMIDTSEAFLNSTGLIALTAAGHLATGVIVSNGGAINLTGNTIDTTANFISSTGTSNSGDITLNATGDINAGLIFTDAATDTFNDSGNITLISTAGNITTAQLSTAGASGGGNVTLSAFKNIQTDSIFANTQVINGFFAINGSGGMINLTSQTGMIDTSRGFLIASGGVTFSTPKDIYTGVIQSGRDITLGGLNGGFAQSINTTALLGENTITFLGATGAISLKAQNLVEVWDIFAATISIQGGDIDTTGGELFGSAGSITLTATNSIKTGDITNYGNDIILTGNSIDTRLGTLDASGLAGGNIELTATSSIYTGDIISDSLSDTVGEITDNINEGNAGNITLASSAGGIEVNGTLSAQGENQAGSITLTAGNNITTGSITNSSAGTGADITLTSQAGTINTSAGFVQSSKNVIMSTPSDILVGEVYAEGDITLGGLNGGAARSITAATRYSYEGYYYGTPSIFAKGAVTLKALNAIDTEDIFGSSITLTGSELSTGSLTAFSGNINLSASTANITAQSIYAGGNGTVDISALGGTVQVTGLIGETNHSILTDGGAITISYSGLNDFTVAEIDTPLLNGTQGTISSSNNQILTGRFPDSYVQSNIQLLADGRLPVVPPANAAPPDQPQTATNLQGITPPFLPPDQPAPSPNRLVPLLNTTGLLRDGLRFSTTEAAINQIENIQQKDLENYLGTPLTKPNPGSESAQGTLRRLARETNRPTAIIYVISLPQQLELILVTPEGKPFRQVIPEAKRDILLALVREFGNEVKDPRKTNSTSYLVPAQKLYQWLIAPLQSELQARKITTLAFSMDTGLRSIPLAALHDGKKFLVEQYSLGLIPSVNLIDTRYQNPKNLEILAMGLSKAVADQVALPAVPIEVATILKSDWQGKSFLNEDFTLDQLKAQRAARPYGIIHLATHGEFKPGPRSNSFIQLWDNRLRLDQVRQLGWNDPPVELLVLSACRTALGDETAELGFAGFAVQAGVKTAVASLWYVSDEATLALMTSFYRQLRTAPIKAEALQQAQIAMLNGKIRVEANTVRGPASEVALPNELANRGDRTLRHPYFWAAFTTIGSPW